MTEAELLTRAAELPATTVAGESAFATLVRSPLLIRRVRGPGGAGGRRVSAGILAGEDPAFAVLVEASGREPSLTAFPGAVACAHAFGAELDRAARDGLAARPEARPVSAGELLAAGAALLR